MSDERELLSAASQAELCAADLAGCSILTFGDSFWVELCREKLPKTSFFIILQRDPFRIHWKPIGGTPSMSELFHSGVKKVEYDVTTPVVITNSDDIGVKVLAQGEIAPGAELLKWE